MIHIYANIRTISMILQHTPRLYQYFFDNNKRKNCLICKWRPNSILVTLKIRRLDNHLVLVYINGFISYCPVLVCRHIFIMFLL